MELLEEYKIQLADLFRTSRLLDVDTDDEKQRISKRLRCPVPVINLYRYFKPDRYALSDLRNGYVTLSNPNGFNDPFDGLLYVDAAKVRESLKIFNKEFLVRQVSIIREGRPIDDRFDVGFQEFLRRIAQVPDDLLEREIYSRCEEIQERSVGIEMERFPKKIREGIRVCCMSENCSSQLMWAHYADSGRGFCVEYEMPSLIWSEREWNAYNRHVQTTILPVLYADERYDATHLIEEFAQGECAAALSRDLRIDTSRHDKLALLKLAAFKSKSWEYEQEWRIFNSPFIEGDADYIRMPAPRIKSVVLGYAIEYATEDLIYACVKDLATTCGSVVAIKRLVVDTASKDYKLRIQDECLIGQGNKPVAISDIQDKVGSS